MKRFESWTGPGGGTRRLHHKHMDVQKLKEAYIKVYGKRWKEYWIKYHWCVYDGGEIGSTDGD